MIIRNLASALQHVLPKMKPSIFWIDAICINQSDLHERKSQVALMSSIYGQAQEVIVWLGEEKENPSLAFEILELATNQKDPIGFVLDVLQNSDWNDYVIALWNSLRREYWHRLWIVQELALASQARIIYGSHSVGLGQFENIALAAWKSMVQKTSEISRGLSSVENNNILHIGKFSDLVVRLSKVDPVPIRQARPHEDFLSLLSLLRDRKATNPCDKVYGLLGLPQQSPSLSIDYSVPTSTVYRRTARYIIEASQKLDILYDCTPDSPLTWKDVEAGASWQLNVPSWAPNWSLYPGIRRLPPGENFSAAGESTAYFKFLGEPDKERLGVIGFCIGKISLYGDATPCVP